MNTSDKTAILLFSRTAQEEAAIKVFDPRMGKRGNGSIARRLIRHTAATVRKSRLPVVNCFSHDQSGSHFGERLANAMEAVFAQGYAQVIAIGNDCPAISAPMLRDAANRLDAGEMVLGPATDGGVYLIGMTQASYDRAQFMALPWQQQELQQGLAAYSATQHSAVAWLAAFADIDHADDFRRALRAMPLSSRLRRQLQSIVAGYAKVRPAYRPPFLATYSSPALLQRGPPA